ncbi:MAG TPA: hypothetical protein VN963_04915, partial [bacterium]|nr:hypothetical protein [bacterium]
PTRYLSGVTDVQSPQNLRTFPVNRFRSLQILKTSGLRSLGYWSNFDRLGLSPSSFESLCLKE